MCLADERLNPSFQFVAAINIDAGADVGLSCHNSGGTRAVASLNLGT